MSFTDRKGSRFHFEDSGPLGDWATSGNKEAGINANNREMQNDAKILDVFVQRTFIPIAVPNPFKTKNKTVESSRFRLKLTISTQAFAGYVVLVQCEGREKSVPANVGLIEWDIEMSVLFLNKDFTFTITLKDFKGNKIDSKFVVVNVDHEGHIEVKNSDIEKKLSEPQMISGAACGIQYRGQLLCDKHGDNYGPVFNGTLKMDNYSHFSTLEQAQRITSDERRIIIAMSENEGNLDAVQSYDSEIVSIGAMQKTVNRAGYGEFPIQLWEFSVRHPEKYKSLLENCGWSVEEINIYKKNRLGELVVAGNKYRVCYQGITGKELKKKIRQGFSKQTVGKKIVCIPLEPLIGFAADVDFQAQQIEDFILRLNQSIQKKPIGYGYKIAEFLKSNLGRATVLDQDINRPAQVQRCFGKALDLFFKKNDSISKNPNEWGDAHQQYEKELLEIYGPLRNDKQNKFTMTDAKNRYLRLKKKL